MWGDREKEEEEEEEEECDFGCIIGPSCDSECYLPPTLGTLEEFVNTYGELGSNSLPPDGTFGRIYILFSPSGGRNVLSMLATKRK